MPLEMRVSGNFTTSTLERRRDKFLGFDFLKSLAVLEGKGEGVIQDIVYFEAGPTSFLRVCMASIDKQSRSRSVRTAGTRSVPVVVCQ